MIWLESTEGLWSKSPFRADDILTHNRDTAGRLLPASREVFVVVDNSGNVITSGK